MLKDKPYSFSVGGKIVRYPIGCVNNERSATRNNNKYERTIISQTRLSNANTVGNIEIQTRVSDGITFILYTRR